MRNFKKDIIIIENEDKNKFVSFRKSLYVYHFMNFNKVDNKYIVIIWLFERNFIKIDDLKQEEAKLLFDFINDGIVK